MVTICALPRDLNPVETFAFFDRINLRTRSRPRAQFMRELKKNASSAFVRVGKPIRNSDQKWLIIVVCPNAKALRLLASEPEFTVNLVECALDVVAEDVRKIDAVFDLIATSFVQARRGRKPIRRWFDGIETKGPETTAICFGSKLPGVAAIAYKDRVSKRAPHDGRCAHLEFRYQGLAAVRRLGIERVKDLVCFDHVAHWKKRLCLYRVDFARFGRAHLNRCENRKRKSSRIDRRGTFVYDVDRRMGAALFRALSTHEGEEFRSVQRFVDNYGRSPNWLRAIDVSSLLPRPPSTFLIVHKDITQDDDVRSMTRVRIAKPNGGRRDVDAEIMQPMAIQNMQARHDRTSNSDSLSVQ